MLGVPAMVPEMRYKVSYNGLRLLAHFNLVKVQKRMDTNEYFKKNYRIPSFVRFFRVD